MKRAQTNTFLLELPLRVDAGQSRRLHAHLETARCFYNALLGEATKRLHQMRSDPAWQAARCLSHAKKQERSTAFSQVRQQYRFSEYAMHDHAKTLRTSWLADHLDSTMAQTLASRAFHAVNRVCLGQAKHVRFKSRGRGFDSVEGKRNDTGMRFVLQGAEEGNQGYLIWGTDRIPALIDWKDGVVQHGLRHRIKYIRLIRRKASSPQARGADHEGNRYVVQLILEGLALQKPKNGVGNESIGLDIGPTSIAIVARHGEVHLKTLCEELKPASRKQRCLQRRMERQRRANNPQNYDERGRVKKGRLNWKTSQQYRATRRQHATTERKLAAYRKSLHGHLINHIVGVGNQIQIEKTSFKSWQRLFGKSVGLRTPGMFYEHLKRIVAKTGGTLREVSTFKTKLSQYCHRCQTYEKKPLSQRWHHCRCGIGPVQRDLYSAFLLAFLKTSETIPSISLTEWEGAEPRLLAEIERLKQRAKEGHWLPRSFGIPRAGARQPKSPLPTRQEPLFQYRKGRVEALELAEEPPCREAGEVSDESCIHRHYFITHDALNVVK
jgi:hypothetical protein